MSISMDDVLDFWLDEVGEERWYKEDATLDATIRDRFLTAWEQAARGEMMGWMRSARGALALLILIDQFPRNMFRGRAEAFATDGLARAMAQKAVDRRFDLQIAEPERQFFYLPLMHSESLSHQERGVRLIKERMERGNNLLHARAHREVIRRFGRFPFRNAALGRQSSPAETAFIDAGGYGATVRALEG